jgi:hypothetical protein
MSTVLVLYGYGSCVFGRLIQPRGVTIGTVTSQIVMCVNTYGLYRDNTPFPGEV